MGRSRLVRMLCPIGKRLKQEFEDATQASVVADGNMNDHSILFAKRDQHRARAAERLFRYKVRICRPQGAIRHLPSEKLSHAGTDGNS
jgi:hypothetical protein